MPQGLPLLKPPYSRMTAIDMNTGDHVWMTPLGNGDRIRNHPMLRDLDLPPLGGDGRGGPLLTKTLLFSALSAGGTDDALFAGPKTAACPTKSSISMATGTRYQLIRVRLNVSIIMIFRPTVRAAPIKTPTRLIMKFSVIK